MSICIILDHGHIVIRVTDQELNQLGIEDKGGSVLINSESEFQKLWDKVKELGKEFTLVPGGSASNTIKAIASFGVQCGLCGKIGNDDVGKIYSERLRERGVNDLTSKSFTSRTGQVLCFVSEDGQRTMRAFLGASLEMGPDDLIEEDFEQHTLLHIEGYAVYNEKLLLRTLKLAQKHKLTVSYDIGSYQIAETKAKLLRKILRDYVSITFCNESEAETLFPQCNGDLREACRQVGKLCHIAVVTCGKDGCFVKDRDGEVFHCPSIPVENPVDTTGAGDLFAAGLIFGVSQGYSLRACSRLGTLSGYYIVQRMGAELPMSTVKKIKSKVNSPSTQLFKKNESQNSVSRGKKKGISSSSSIPIRV